MKELKKYYRQIGSWLPCGGKLKNEMIARLKETVTAYLQENPSADFPALQAHFGTPQQIATAFVDEMGTEELLIKLHVRNRIIKIVFICAGTLVAIWGLVALSLWIVGLLDTLGPTIVEPPMIIR